MRNKFWRMTEKESYSYHSEGDSISIPQRHSEMQSRTPPPCHEPVYRMLLQGDYALNLKQYPHTSVTVAK